MGLNFGSFYFLSGDCNFEQNFCTWINMAGDQFDWIRGSGSTTSGFTGPSRDRLGSSSGIELPVTCKCKEMFHLIYPVIHNYCYSQKFFSNSTPSRSHDI